MTLWTDEEIELAERLAETFDPDRFHRAQKTYDSSFVTADWLDLARDLLNEEPVP